jgi:serine palmitoyltransferase
MLNILKNIYLEVCFYIDMIKICFQQNSIVKYNNIKDIVFNAMMKHFDYCFKIVNSGIGKYIIIKNKDTGETYTSLNFGSYDYMGISNIILPNEREYLIELYHKYKIQSEPLLINKLEQKITHFLNRNSLTDTIVMNGGYQANSIYLPIILSEYTIVLSDVDNHASIIKGLQHIKKLKEIKIKTFESVNNLNKMLKLIDPKEKIIVVVEGIYSMKGTILELDKIMALKRKYNFHLYIDEAHSAGSLGDNLGGICDYYGFDPNRVEYLMGTFSKTFNAHGSYLSGPLNIIGKLKKYRYDNNYNTFPAISTYHVLSIYNYLEENNNNIPTKFKDLIKYAYNSILTTNLNIISNPDSPVICIRATYRLGDLIGKYCIKNNVSIVLAGYPAVQFPYGIVRICISMNHTYEDIDYLVSCLKLSSNEEYKKTIINQKLQQIDSKYLESNNVTDTLKNLSIGTAGPPGFYGYLSMTVMLEDLIKRFTHKSSCLVLPHSTSGFYDIIFNIIKRYNYKYICVYPDSIDSKLLDNILRSTNCTQLDKGSEGIDKNTILYINYIPSEERTNCLKIIDNFKEDVSNYKYIIGSFDKLCNGMGCFFSYDENEYGFQRQRTTHSSYVFSATLPMYIIHHNLSQVAKLLG